MWSISLKQLRNLETTDCFAIAWPPAHFRSPYLFRVLRLRPVELRGSRRPHLRTMTLRSAANAPKRARTN
jgi:hypothetical protein